MTKRNYLKALLQEDPETIWEVKRFPEHHYNKDGVLTTSTDVPYLFTKVGYFVETSIEHKQKRKSYLHPVVDDEGKQIVHPNLVHIKAAIDTCLEINASMFKAENLIETQTPEKKGDHYTVVDNTDVREELMLELTKEVNSKKLPFQQFSRFVTQSKGVGDITKLSNEDLREVIDKVKALSPEQVSRIIKQL